jgi:hypothetical protein
MMIWLPVALLTQLVASTPTDRPSPAAAPPSSAPVIVFLLDNSASLPPLDPAEKRVEALEKVFTFLKGQRYRLILFGGRDEIYIDDVSRYRNDGQWTDFYFAFAKAKELIDSYPPGTEFRVILLTDGLLDPKPSDWQDMGVPTNLDLKSYSVTRLTELLKQMQQPLYVILIGDPQKGGVSANDRERTPLLILDMVQAANGARASPMAQTVSSFFGDNGVLLKKFIFRVPPSGGLAQVKPVIQRIVSAPSAGVELQFLSVLVLPLTLLLFLLLGIMVRSFPGAGDVEILELNANVPANLAFDRVRRIGTGAWASRGLSLVEDARGAAASLTYSLQKPDWSGAGLDTSDLDPITQRLLPLDLGALKRELEVQEREGTKEERVFALNLDYMGQNFDSALAERIVCANPTERRRHSALDFLRAKVHLLSNQDLVRKLTEPRLVFVSYGRDAVRREVVRGDSLRVGPYRFKIKDIVHGGRKDAKVLLSYTRVPSLLGLKTILPNAFQRWFRLRRTSQRIVG